MKNIVFDLYVGQGIRERDLSSRKAGWTLARNSIVVEINVAVLSSSRSIESQGISASYVIEHIPPYGDVRRSCAIDAVVMMEFVR